MGRMGNCLFQIAATISTALRNGTDYQFPRWEYEKDFNIPFSKFVFRFDKHPVYQEPYFHYAPIPDWKNIELVGYLQSYKFFDDYKYEIIGLLTPKPHFDREKGLCSIHIRHGDYVHQPENHPTQPMIYYEKAMERSGSKRFLVFSDDLAWCKNNFKGNQFDFAEGNSPPVDLAMMAKKCENNIICNSSLSYWGGMLNRNPNKKVIYPSTWFGPKLTHNTKDLCPPEWEKI